MKKQIILVSFLIVILLSLVNSETFGYGNTREIPINYSLIPTVNSSDWWDNLDTPADILGSLINNDLGWITTSEEIDSLSLHLTQDNWNNDSNGWIYWNNPMIVFNESKLSTIYYNATQSEIIAGTIDGGSLSDTQHPNGDYDGITFNFTEVSSSPALDLRINFTDVTNFNNGIMRYKTSVLKGNYPIIQLWNYDDGLWEDYPVLGESESFATITQPVYDDSEHLGNGVVQMRLYKSTNGNTNNHYYVDWIAVSNGYGTPSGQEVDPFSWHRNQVGETANFSTTGNVTASYFIGNGSLLTGIDGDNSSFNESHTDDLYVNVNGDTMTGGLIVPNINVTKNITLQPTTSSSVGVVYQNGERFLHSYGTNNLFLGDRAGNFATTGFQNTGIGTRVLQGLTSGKTNLCEGYYSCDVISTGSRNMGIGTGVLGKLTTGSDNVAIGTYVLGNLVTGSGNFGFGRNTFTSSDSSSNNNIGIGNYVFGTGGTQRYLANNVVIGFMGFGNPDKNMYGNTAMGHYVGRYASGDYNSFFGYYTGYNTSGDYNSFLGYYAGRNSIGSNNVFIGTNVGKDSEVSNKLYIDNSDTSTPLIEGDFSEDIVKINGDFNVTGNVSSNGYLSNGKLGLTGNYTNGNCWTKYTGGITTATNCSLA